MERTRIRVRNDEKKHQSRVKKNVRGISVTRHVKNKYIHNKSDKVLELRATNVNFALSS